MFQVLIALKFYASGSYQEVVGSSSHCSVSQPSVSRAIREVSLALNQPEIFGTWVHFPQNFLELEELRTR